ncbi:hypothetical protein CsSME_00046479 [Camellia sinensis var. sinensis]
MKNKEIPNSFMLNLGCGSPCGVRVEVPWKPQKSDESKAFAHSNNSSCPCEPKPWLLPNKN